jgi:hypothetical protein
MWQNLMFGGTIRIFVSNTKERSNRTRGPRVTIVCAFCIMALVSFESVYFYKQVTPRSTELISVAGTLETCVWDVLGSFETRPGHWPSWLRGGVRQSPQANAAVVPCVKPRTCPFKSFRFIIHRSRQMMPYTRHGPGTQSALSRRAQPLALCSFYLTF